MGCRAARVRVSTAVVKPRVSRGPGRQALGEKTRPPSQYVGFVSFCKRAPANDDNALRYKAGRDRKSAPDRGGYGKVCPRQRGYATDARGGWLFFAGAREAVGRRGIRNRRSLLQKQTNRSRDMNKVHCGRLATGGGWAQRREVFVALFLAPWHRGPPPFPARLRRRGGGTPVVASLSLSPSLLFAPVESLKKRQTTYYIRATYTSQEKGGRGRRRRRRRVGPRRRRRVVGPDRRRQRVWRRRGPQLHVGAQRRPPVQYLHPRVP